MKNSIFKINLIAATILLTLFMSAQTSQTEGVPGPPKGDGSHMKDTSYSISGASKNEVRGESGQGSVGNTDTMPPKRKHKVRFTYTAPNSTNGTSGSNIAPGR